MTGMDPAIEAVEAELRRWEKQRNPGWSGNCFSDAVAVIAAARPSIESALLARLISDQTVEAGAQGRYEYQRKRLPDVKQEPWDELVPPVQQAYINEARSILAAAVRAAQEDKQ